MKDTRCTYGYGIWERMSVKIEEALSEMAPTFVVMACIVCCVGLMTPFSLHSCSSACSTSWHLARHLATKGMH